MKKVKPFQLSKNDKLPPRIDTVGGQYYLDSNKFLGFGYWYPTHEDPNIWTSVENKPHKIQKLKDELNSGLSLIVNFLYYED